MSYKDALANTGPFGVRFNPSDDQETQEHLLNLLAAQKLPSWWRSIPSWIQGGYERDEMAFKCEQIQKFPFLISGRPPAAGQRLYVAVDYEHDGSHPETYRGWARMVGEVTKVLPPPPPGVYGHYPREEVHLTDQELEFLRSNMPEMPPSYLHSCQCGRIHTRENTLMHDGAVHGQALLAKICLSSDDANLLKPQLSGDWDAMFICNDNKQAYWELRAMKRAGGKKKGKPAKQQGKA